MVAAVIPYDRWIIYGYDDDYHAGHPLLPAGWNSAAINADMINGPGLNDTMVPVTCASAQVLRPIVLQRADLEQFACASATIPAENRTVHVQPESRTVRITRRCA